MPFGVELHLGRRAFVFIVFKNTILAFVSFFAAWLIRTFQGLIQTKIWEAVNITGQNNSLTFENLGIYIHNLYIILSLVGILIFILGLVLSMLFYNFYTYKLEEFDLKLKRGILTIKEISIPYRQIQNVNIDRSILYRIFGLSRIIMDSAGHEEYGKENESDVLLDPINANIAVRIRTTLERKVGIQIVQDEVDARV